MLLRQWHNGDNSKDEVSGKTYVIYKRVVYKAFDRCAGDFLIHSQVAGVIFANATTH